MGPKKEKSKEVEVEYDPYANRKVDLPLTDLDAAFHLLKITFGTGVLALPYAVKEAGWMLGIILTFVVGFINTYAMLLLVKASYILCKKFKKPSLRLPETLEYAVELHFPKKGYIARRVSNFFYLLYLVWVCCAYVVFMADNLTSVVNVHSSRKFTDREMILMFVLILVVFNMIRNLKYLVPVTILGHILTLFVFGTVFYYIFKDGIHLDDKEAFRPKGFPSFYGHILFAIMPIAMLMSIENKMKHPDHFKQSLGPLSFTMTINTLITCFIGVVGYLKYGENLQGAITTNMPPGEILGQVAKCAYVFVIGIDFILNVFLLIELTFFGWCSHTACIHELFNEIIYRIFIVIVLCAICIGIPNFTIFVDLAGSIAFTYLGLIIPSVTDFFARWDKKLPTKNKVILILKDGILLFFALFGMIVGTTGAIINLIKYIQTGKK